MIARKFCPTHSRSCRANCPSAENIYFKAWDICLKEDDLTEGSYNPLRHEEECPGGIEPINVFLGTVTSKEYNIPQPIELHNFNTHPEKIYVVVNINRLHNLKLKVDTGADASVITTTDLQIFHF